MFIINADLFGPYSWLIRSFLSLLAMLTPNSDIHDQLVEQQEKDALLEVEREDARTGAYTRVAYEARSARHGLTTLACPMPASN